jgi:nitrate reductase gamma subunit
VTAPTAKSFLLATGVAALVLIVVGATGALTAAWGYGLLLLSAVGLVAGLGALSLFVFTDRFDGDALLAAARWAGGLGGFLYGTGAGALLGFFLFETVQGRMEAKWIVFAPLVVAALVVFDIGFYEKIIKTNLATHQRFRRFLDRQDAEPERMRSQLMDEVVIHRTLYGISPFRWFKHTLILWGFAVMLGLEGLAVCFREVFPAVFGWHHLWAAGHPVRLVMDFAFDVTGLMILIGCALALAWRVHVNGTDEQKYTDTPTAALLFLVVVTGFWVEGLRLAGLPMGAGASFVGYALAATVFSGADPNGTAYEILWLVHMAVACLFIGYVPVRRLIHTCATPIGRLMQSQTALLAAKKRGVMQGLLGGSR